MYSTIRWVTAFQVSFRGIVEAHGFVYFTSDVAGRTIEMEKPALKIDNLPPFRHK
ncbi:hypothetical protein DPMN_193455 [Dreissena polymorpha]|uniref:Uncharacterized protein n=1 Tax=Dreissena polymorpha TaxID=45954 RepID=A0A9D4B5W2_DREPO|nr:hypothetical protein DPMN_193455 [Dreissena polymorpha]